MAWHKTTTLLSVTIMLTFIIFTGGFPILHKALQWRHNARDGVSDHQPYDCLPNRLFGRRSKKTSKLRVTGLCVGNSPVTGEFPSQRVSNAENFSISWRHQGSRKAENDSIPCHWLSLVNNCVPGRLAKFTRYCLAKLISQLPGSVKSHWERHYLVNVVLLGVKDL